MNRKIGSLILSSLLVNQVSFAQNQLQGFPAQPGASPEAVSQGAQVSVETLVKLRAAKDAAELNETISRLAAIEDYYSDNKIVTDVIAAAVIGLVGAFTGLLIVDHKTNNRRVKITQPADPAVPAPETTSKLPRGSYRAAGIGAVVGVGASIYLRHYSQPAAYYAQQKQLKGLSVEQAGVLYKQLAEKAIALKLRIDEAITVQAASSAASAVTAEASAPAASASASASAPGQ